MKRTTSIIAWAIAGAMLAVVVLGVYRLYVVRSNGLDVSGVPLRTLLIDVLNLHYAVVLGLLGGALLGLLEKLFWGLHRLFGALRGRKRGELPASTPDAIIHQQRAVRAQRYMSIRRTEAEAGSEDAPDARVETIVTAHDGAVTYRVLAYRALSQHDAQAAVRAALREGRITPAQPGQSVVVTTDIGKHASDAS